MTIDEWEALPWWQQLVYTEGLGEEFYDPDSDLDDGTDDLDSVMSLGANVRKIEAPA
jgi:hypothetical protein